MISKIGFNKTRSTCFLELGKIQDMLNIGSFFLAEKHTQVSFILNTNFQNFHFPTLFLPELVLLAMNYCVNNSD